MIYLKEKYFLKTIPDYLIRDLLTYDFWDKVEKDIIKFMFLENKSIENIIVNKLIPYEKSQANEYYKNGLSKLQKFLKSTQNPNYTRLYKLLK